MVAWAPAVGGRGLQRGCHGSVAAMAALTMAGVRAGEGTGA